ncbi:hypothetical protein [Streptomyces sp. NPDC102264]|uniref:hypothetical protein n=1 Tax=Streptomyces sp. NPDC102264 TaxID=3366149 RepID=UPI00380BF2A7
MKKVPPSGTGRPTLDGRYYDKVRGGCLPGPIWRIAMTGALDTSDAPAFKPVSVPRGKKEKTDKNPRQG